MLRWFLAAFSVGGTLAGLGFAAKQISVTWAIVLWAVSGAAFLALLSGPKVAGIGARWRASRKRPWVPYQPSGTRASVNLYDASGAVHKVRFSLGMAPGTQYTVDTKGPVKKVAFTEPLAVTVRQEELPRRVNFRWERYSPDATITVHAFTNEGVVLEDRVPRPIAAAMNLYR